MGRKMLDITEMLKLLYAVDPKTAQRTWRIMQTVLQDALPSDQQIDNLHPEDDPQ